jgi:hypothetical protein
MQNNCSNAALCSCNPQNKTMDIQALTRFFKKEITSNELKVVITQAQQIISQCKTHPDNTDPDEVIYWLDKFKTLLKQ